MARGQTGPRLTALLIFSCLDVRLLGSLLWTPRSADQQIARWFVNPGTDVAIVHGVRWSKALSEEWSSLGVAKQRVNFIRSASVVASHGGTPLLRGC